MDEVGSNEACEYECELPEAVLDEGMMPLEVEVSLSCWEL